MSNLKDARNHSYIPTTPGDWPDPDPTTVQEALDQIAAIVAGLSGGITDKTLTMITPAGSTGVFFAGGFLQLGSTANDFSPSITHGIVNNPYAAHVMVVVGAVPVDTITISVTGTRIEEDGTRTAAYTGTITLDTGNLVNDYLETSEKFIGQVTIETTAGTAVLCNFGFNKYWDNNNSRFTVVGWDATWTAGANDTGADISVHHHKATGWTYNAGSEPSLPSPIASMVDDYGAESDLTNNEPGSYKRSGESTDVRGDLEEGVIIVITAGSGKAFELANFILSITTP